MAQRQFRSDDTSRWREGFGKGIYGDITISSSQTFYANNGAQFPAGNHGAPTFGTIVGTAGNYTAAVTDRHGFTSTYNTAGEPVLIHQSRGTGAGNWELNVCVSVPATGTMTFKYPLQNNYATSGASVAQIVKIPQYRNFTVNGGVTLSTPAWDGIRFGILPLMVSGTLTINGAISASASGFRGGANSPSGGVGYRGEGSEADNSTRAYTNNGSGAGAGQDSANQSRGGGGGGNATSGANGGTDNGFSGRAGTATGNASLTSMFFGGGGGTGGARNDYGYGSGGFGGTGGGIIAIFASTLVVAGSIQNSGAPGQNAPNSQWVGAGGGGAAGSNLIKGRTVTLGAGLVTANAGAGGARSDPGNSGAGGNGSVGRIHLDYSLSYSGSTSPGLDVRQDSTIKPRAGGANYYQYFL